MKCDCLVEDQPDTKHQHFDMRNILFLIIAVRHTSFSSNSYSATCQKMLLSVYEELLLPVPVELGGSRLGSPQREDAKADSVSSNDDERSVGQQLVNDVSSAPVKTVTMHRSASNLCVHITAMHNYMNHFQFYASC